MRALRPSARYLVSILLVCALLSAYAAFRLSKARTYQLFGDLRARVETTQKIVALTLDDGPTEHTDEVLRVLDAKGIKATFYVIGDRGRTYPGTLKRIVSDGHELGNHSFTHHRFLLRSPSFVSQEIESTNQVIRDAGYSGQITFRPPYGKKLIGLPWYLSQHHIKTITCDVEPDTHYPHDAALLKKYALDNVKPGSIILLHPFCAADCAAAREALPAIIDGVRAQGYRFVTMSELLNYDHAGR